MATELYNFSSVCDPIKPFNCIIAVFINAVDLLWKHI